MPSVHVALRAGVLTASVTDNGLPGFPPESSGTGRGLLGLRERVTSLGGTLAAGPRTDGQGWKVEATVRLDDEAEGESS